MQKAIDTFADYFKGAPSGASQTFTVEYDDGKKVYLTCVYVVEEPKPEPKPASPQYTRNTSSSTIIQNHTGTGDNIGLTSSSYASSFSSLGGFD